MGKALPEETIVPVSSPSANVPSFFKRVVLIGRPNVGKSTLFNRLARQRLAVVYDMPGVTRDWKEHAVEMEGKSVLLVDTPGLELEQARMADHIIFVCDAKSGILPQDWDMLKQLKALPEIAQKPITLVLNKSEKSSQQWVDGETHTFARFAGCEPLLISALHGQGVSELEAEIANSSSLMASLAAHSAQNSQPKAEQEGESASAFIPKVVIIGRPNSGKSTLTNAILGQERMRVGPQAGLTRDVVDNVAELNHSHIILCDTPGLKKRSKLKDELEHLSWKETIKAIRFAHVAILLIDATCPFEVQDLRIAKHVIDEGRAIIIVLNKWDLIEDKKAALKRAQADLECYLPKCRSVPIIPISALKKQGLQSLAPRLQATLAAWRKVITTSKLNRWLQEAVMRHAPPKLPDGKTLSLKYATQIKSAPPTFAIFTNIEEKKFQPYYTRVLEQYERYLSNSLYEKFSLFGSPVRISFQTRKEKDSHYRESGIAAAGGGHRSAAVRSHKKP